MWQVTVNNSVQSRNFGPIKFGTEAEADAWIAEQEAKHSWGNY